MDLKYFIKQLQKKAGNYNPQVGINVISQEDGSKALKSEFWLINDKAVNMMDHNATISLFQVRKSKTLPKHAQIKTKFYSVDSVDADAQSIKDRFNAFYDVDSAVPDTMTKEQAFEFMCLTIHKDIGEKIRLLNDALAHVGSKTFQDEWGIEVVKNER